MSVPAPKRPDKPRGLRHYLPLLAVAMTLAGGLALALWQEAGIHTADAIVQVDVGRPIKSAFGRGGFANDRGYRRWRPDATDNDVRLEREDVAVHFVYPGLELRLPRALEVELSSSNAALGHGDGRIVAIAMQYASSYFPSRYATHAEAQDAMQALIDQFRANPRWQPFVDANGARVGGRSSVLDAHGAVLDNAMDIDPAYHLTRAEWLRATTKTWRWTGDGILAELRIHSRDGPDAIHPAYDIDLTLEDLPEALAELAAAEQRHAQERIEGDAKGWELSKKWRQYLEERAAQNAQRRRQAQQRGDPVLAPTPLPPLPVPPPADAPQGRWYTPLLDGGAWLLSWMGKAFGFIFSAVMGSGVYLALPVLLVCLPFSARVRRMLLRWPLWSAFWLVVLLLPWLFWYGIGTVRSGPPPPLSSPQRHAGLLLPAGSRLEWREVTHDAAFFGARLPAPQRIGGVLASAVWTGVRAWPDDGTPAQTLYLYNDAPQDVEGWRCVAELGHDFAPNRHAIAVHADGRGGWRLAQCLLAQGNRSAAGELPAGAVVQRIGPGEPAPPRAQWRIVLEDAVLLYLDAGRQPLTAQ
ncbi:MAG: hypothetical protein QM581_16720 [Pseudomonas sp.]